MGGPRWGSHKLLFSSVGVASIFGHLCDSVALNREVHVKHVQNFLATRAWICVMLSPHLGIWYPMASDIRQHTPLIQKPMEHLVNYTTRMDRCSFALSACFHSASPIYSILDHLFPESLRDESRLAQMKVDNACRDS